MTEEGNEGRSPDGDARRGRLVFLGLALLFIGPLAFAWMMYFSGGLGQPQGRVNHGVLLDPARPLPEVELDHLAGTSGEEPDLRHRWTLIQAHPEGCHADCVEALYRSRQVWLSLGRRSARVQRLLLVPGLPARSEALMDSHPRLQVADSRRPAGRELLSALDAAAPDGAALYLVDPLGNLVMVYPADYEEKGLLEDLERLLKLSRIG